MKRADLLSQLGELLGTKDLVWFGTRGDDVEGAADLPNLAGAYSVIAPYERRSTVDGVALEQLSGVRVDLDAHDIDEAPREPAVLELRRGIMKALGRPSFAFTYRPSTFLSAICFARRDRSTYLGMFKDHQAAFEHKPWVETAVAEVGLPHIPWTYIADEEQMHARRLLENGPIMLRRSRTSGGTGLAKVETPDQLADSWMRQDEVFLSVAPFVENALPVNIGGVAFNDGVTVHLPSVQLIGIPSCTTRPFGYCGNDFGAARDFDPALVDAIERSTRTVGAWLRRRGYRGAFGLDFLVRDGEPLFTEVNARFQGSTHLSCQISVLQGESCLMLEHLAALLGLPCPIQRPLRDQVRHAPDLAHVVPHWAGPQPHHVDGTELVLALAALPKFVRADVVAAPTRSTLPGGPIARVTMAERLTSTGFDLAEHVDSLVTKIHERAVSVDILQEPSKEAEGEQRP
jgi:hypothetical protein